MPSATYIAYLVPELNVEAKVDVEVLVMVVVEDAVWLPWLKPLALQINHNRI